MPNLQPFETHLSTKQLVADKQRAHYLRPVRNYLTFYEKSVAPAEDGGTIKPATHVGAGPNQPFEKSKKYT